MSGRRLVVLAALLLGVALYYRFYEVEYKQEQQAKEVEAKQLFQFETDSAAEMVFVKGKETIALAKVDGQWRLTEPVEEDADATTVSSVLRSLDTLTPDRALENPESLDEYGLKDPEFTLTVRDENAEPLAVLHVGHTTADKASRYVQSKDALTVGILSTGTFGSVDKDLFALRSKRWTKIPVDSVQELRFSHDGETVGHVLRDGPDSDTWLVSGTEPKAGDGEKIRRTLGQIINARIQSVVKESTLSLEPYGLHAPPYIVSFKTLEGDTSLRIGHVVPDKAPVEYYAMIADDPRILTFTSAVIERVPDSPDDLRDARILRESTDGISSITVAHGETIVNLERDAAADEWTFGGGVRQRAGSAQVDALLRDLRGLKATRFLHLDSDAPLPANFTNPAISVSYAVRDASAPRILLLAQGEATGEWYANRDGDDEVYPVSADAVKRLQVTPEQLADRHLFAFDEESVGRIEVRINGRKLDYRKQSDGDWKAGIGAPAIEAHTLGQFLWAVSDLVYQRRVTPDDPALSRQETFGATLSTLDGSTIAGLHIHGAVADEDESLFAARTHSGETVAIESGLQRVWDPIFSGSTGE